MSILWEQAAIRGQNVHHGELSWESHLGAKDHEHWDKQETISAMSAFTRITNIYFSCFNKFYAFLAATSPAPPPAREGHFTINFTMTNLLYTSAFENPNSKQSLATKKALTYLVSVTQAPLVSVAFLVLVFIYCDLSTGFVS